MFVIVGALVLLLSACSSATPPPAGPEAGRALVEESAAALGGWAALDAVKSQEILTAGSDWEPGQAVEPVGEGLLINTFSQRTIVDFEKNRMRLTFDSIRFYPASSPARFTHVIDGDAGMVETVAVGGKVIRERLHPSSYVTRLRDIRRLPVRVLHTARNSSDLTQVEDKTEGATTLHVLRYTDGGSPVELHLDSVSRRPARVIYTEDDTIYGDTLNELAFSDWKDYSGIRLPQSQTMFLNGTKIREERVRILTNNATLDEALMTVPADVRSQPDIGDPIVSQWAPRRAVMGISFQHFGRPQAVDLVEIAKGVYQAKGGTHNSLAIEMKDHLVVIEAPLYEERSLAVIKTLEEKFPGKPIKYLVMTHFHNDHSGGVRAYAAKGVTIVAHEALVPFVQTLLSRPKTIRPDSLSKAGKVTPTVESVTATKSLTDGERTIELRGIVTSHSIGMLFAYLPGEKLVFVGDLWAPGIVSANDDIVGEVELYRAITDAKLSVDRIAAVHGSVGPLRDLAKIATTPES